MRNTRFTLLAITFFGSLLLPNCAAPRTAICGNTKPSLREPTRPETVVLPAAGEVATFPEATLVKVRNLEPLEASTGRFEFDNECLALEGGQVTVVARYALRVLVRYEPPKKKFYGVCPSGTLFFVDTMDLKTMDERYQANQAKLESERKLVERLLKP